MILSNDTKIFLLWNEKNKLEKINIEISNNKQLNYFLSKCY